jgi:hypothetical protein
MTLIPIGKPRFPSQHHSSIRRQVLTLSRYDDVFYTGVVREYWLEVVNTTLAPDGYERVVLTINGTIPGPEIVADWGDEIVVHVTNNLENNGTTIHWHGIRQLNTAEFDGVPGVTQCPIPPGGEMTYRFHASQYRTSVRSLDM